MADAETASEKGPSGAFSYRGSHVYGQAAIAAG